MSFLAPMLWPLLGLICVPIVIHLLTRRPPQPLAFAPIELLRRALRRQERRLRLRRWLVLLARTGWVGCFALAALQPQCGREAVAEDVASGAVALLLDSSGSMATKGGDGQTFLARAKVRAQREASRRPASLFACTYAGVKRLAPEPRAALDVMSLMGDVRAMGRVDLAACAQAVQGDVLLISDGWSRLPEGVKTVTVAKPNEGQNWGIGAVTMSRRGGRSYRLRIEIVGRVGTRRVRAMIDGEARAQIHVDVPASGQAYAMLTLGLEPGFHRVTLALDADARADDNQRVIGLNAVGATRVLAINGDARDTAYADELFYVRQAARALGHHDPFDLTVVGLGGESAAPLQDSDVVLLANTAALDPGFSQALRAFVVAGGGVLVTVGQNTRPDALGRQLNGLMPVQIRARWLTKDEEGKASRLAGLPVAAPKPSLLKSMGLSGGAGLLRTRVWSGLNVDASSDVVWRLKDGRPLLLEHRLGSGRVALLTTSVDRDGSDAAIRPGFVPFLRAYFRRLAGEQASGLSPGLTPGELWRSDPVQGVANFRHSGGGVALAKRVGDVLVFAPTRFGLWSSADLGAHVELRVDPSESLPFGGSQEGGLIRSAQRATGTEQEPLWVIMLVLALVFLVGEAALVWLDHQGRTA